MHDILSPRSGAASACHDRNWRKAVMTFAFMVSRIINAGLPASTATGSTTSPSTGTCRAAYSGGATVVRPYAHALVSPSRALQGYPREQSLVRLLG